MGVVGRRAWNKLGNVERKRLLLDAVRKLPFLVYPYEIARALGVPEDEVHVLLSKKEIVLERLKHEREEASEKLAL